MSKCEYCNKIMYPWDKKLDGMHLECCLDKGYKESFGVERFGRMLPPDRRDIIEE